MDFQTAEFDVRSFASWSSVPRRKFPRWSPKSITTDSSCPSNKKTGDPFVDRAEIGLIAFGEAGYAARFSTASMTRPTYVRVSRRIPPGCAGGHEQQQQQQKPRREHHTANWQRYCTYTCDTRENRHIPRPRHQEQYSCIHETTHQALLRNDEMAFLQRQTYSEQTSADDGTWSNKTSLTSLDLCRSRTRRRDSPRSLSRLFILALRS